MLLFSILAPFLVSLILVGIFYGMGGVDKDLGHSDDITSFGRGCFRALGGSMIAWIGVFGLSAVISLLVFFTVISGPLSFVEALQVQMDSYRLSDIGSQPPWAAATTLFMVISGILLLVAINQNTSQKSAGESAH